MACLRSLSRRSLCTKWLCCKTSKPDLLHHHIKENTDSSFLESSLLIRSFHRQVFFEDRRKMSFVQPVGSFGVLLRRPMSSKPEESGSKIDAFGNVVEELIASEKPVEAMATNDSSIDACTAAIEKFSFPEDFVQYVISGIHELTGFNWPMSVVLTAFLVSVLMSPVSMRVVRQIGELGILDRIILEVKRARKVGNREIQAKRKKWVAELEERFQEGSLSFFTVSVPDMFIYISFMSGITTMAKKIPDMSISDSLYILPLLAGYTFWLSNEIHITNKSQTSLLSRMKRLPLFLFFFVAFQATCENEPTTYLYMITSRIYVTTLLLLLRSYKMVKLRRILGWSNVPVRTVAEQERIKARMIKLRSSLGLPNFPETTVPEQQRIMARLLSQMREFIDVVKKKDKK